LVNSGLLVFGEPPKAVIELKGAGPMVELDASNLMLANEPRAFKKEMASGSLM